MGITGTIFNIQRYCIHDGEGLRTTIFLKGCPLRCLWCANPESQLVAPQGMYDRRSCQLCGQCAAVCPQKRISVGEAGLQENDNACIGCGTCQKACIYHARELAGKPYTVEEVVDICLRDAAFYARSHGGVTLSGGEPFLQPEFALALLDALKAQGLSTAVETCGHVPWQLLEQAKADQFLYDFKCFDEQQHIFCTGVSNQRIKENLERLLRAGRDVIVRMPMIPGYNMDPDMLEETARYFSQIGVKTVHLLPYHNMGMEKYRRLGLPYQLETVAVPDSAAIQQIAAIMTRFGMTTAIDG